VYISCDPATLARDAAQLTAAGRYVATDAWPLDVMPQTAHVEVVMRLARA
jgi:23S rRNA (uracil1939-C5)-methyltransferase